MAENTNNNATTSTDGENSVFKIEGAVPGPGQTTMFDGSPTEEPTKMDIPHSDSPVYAAPVDTAAHDDIAAPVVHEEEAVSSGTKMKIVATLVIVGIAGYAAYWVQEPVQLKTDVIGYGSTSADSATTGTTAGDTSTSGGTVADSGTATTTTTTTTTSTGKNVSVDVSLFGFDPATLTVDKGDTVVWTNTSTQDQTIIGTAPDGESFASPVLTSGQTYSYKFDQDADFEYYSTYNPALKATIKVGLGSILPADATATTTTDTSVPTTTSAPAETTATPTTTSTDLGLGAASTTVTSTTTTTLPTSELDMSALAAAAAAADQLHQAAPAQITPTRLSKTGPAEDLYAVMAVVIVWFNRKKLAKVFKK